MFEYLLHQSPEFNPQIIMYHIVRRMKYYAHFSGALHLSTLRDSMKMPGECVDIFNNFISEERIAHLRRPIRWAPKLQAIELRLAPSHEPMSIRDTYKLDLMWGGPGVLTPNPITNKAPMQSTREENLAVWHQL